MRCTAAAALLLAATACGGRDLTAPNPSGILEIVTVSSGSPPDADGYTIQVDGGAPHPISANGTSRSTLSPGPHAALLAGLTANCAAAGDNPRTVNVVAGGTTTLTFTITCGDAAGRLALTVTTSGTSQDPNGYFVSVETGASWTIAPSGSHTLAPLSPGTHVLAIGNVAANCLVVGGTTRNFSIVAGTVTALAFEVHCWTETPIAFVSSAPGLLAIFSVNSDGTGLRKLVDEAQNPVWSPDGRRILFAHGGTVLHLMDPDGGNETPMAGTEGAVAYQWSSDGLMLAYLTSTDIGESVIDELWVVGADGSGKRKLATNADGFSWAPDGRSIAYAASSRDLGPHIRLVNVDGSGDRQLSQSLGAFHPAWSPDGARIAFSTLSPDPEIYLINPDGSGLTNLTQGRAGDVGPVWSPDGSRLAFTTLPLGVPSANEVEVAVMNRDGTGRLVLTHTPGPGSTGDPRWSPEGQRIAFTMNDGLDLEVFVMNADGSHPVNITSRPGTLESGGEWAPLPR
jgi:Tol biopolymer transport system component